MICSVTIYYVNCKACKGEIELDRKPRGENIATAFSGAWSETLECKGCNLSNRYERSDVKERQERAE